jgi:uncharacterized protein YdeI (YjbR/CyaY-like superfamily)
MGKKDARVDAYIAKSAEFARPILNHLRGLIHSVCPEVEETIKWNAPSFEYKGLLCMMPAFKQHCALIFWHPAMRARAREVALPATQAIENSMGGFGRITSLADLPNPRQMTKLFKEAVALNEAGGRPKRSSRTKAIPLEVPNDLKLALKKNARARANFDGFPPSHRNEYIQWITEAKRPETRAKRTATTIQWLTQGKDRNWKYKKC